jgi:hypothetical protein
MKTSIWDWCRMLILDFATWPLKYLANTFGGFGNYGHLLCDKICFYCCRVFGEKPMHKWCFPSLVLWFFAWFQHHVCALVGATKMGGGSSAWTLECKWPWMHMFKLTMKSNVTNCLAPSFDTNPLNRMWCLVTTFCILVANFLEYVKLVELAML